MVYLSHRLDMFWPSRATSIHAALAHTTYALHCETGNLHTERIIPTLRAIRRNLSPAQPVVKQLVEQEDKHPEIDKQKIESDRGRNRQTNREKNTEK